MAYTKEDKAVIKKLKKAEIELTGEETTEELAALAADLPEETSTSAISFRLRSGAVRTFSEAEHGDDFEAIASEFEENNTAKDGGSPHKDYIVSKETA